MRTIARVGIACAVGVWFCVTLAWAQQAASAPVAAQSAAEAIHYAGPGVMAPKPIRPGLPRLVSSHCGTVTLSAVVDAKGKADQIDVLHADNPKLGKLVTKLLARTKFEPGTYKGAPVAVAITAVVDMQMCVRHLMAENLSMSVSAREPPQNAAEPSSSPPPVTAPGSADAIYKIGGAVSPPVLIHSVPAQFSSYARRKKISGSCLLGLVVDARGLPQDVHVIQSLEPSLDEKAMEALKQYRFKPALKDGALAVPVRLTVKVEFRLN